AGGGIGPDADIALLHAVLAHRRKPVALLGLEQTDLNVVVPVLHADAGLRLQTRKAPIEGVPCVEAADGAAIKLVELIAIDGVVEKIGEIVVELQVGADDIGADLALAVLARSRPVAGKAEAAAGAAISWIKRPKPAADAL